MPKFAFVGIDLQAERAILKNDGSEAESLGGCFVQDLVGKHRSSSFPDVLVPPGGTVNIWTAPDTDKARAAGCPRQEGSKDIFWLTKRGLPRKQPILNDDGDGLVLCDEEGERICDISSHLLPAHGHPSRAPSHEKLAPPAAVGGGIAAVLADAPLPPLRLADSEGGDSIATEHERGFEGGAAEVEDRLPTLFFTVGKYEAGDVDFPTAAHQLTATFLSRLPPITSEVLSCW